MPKSRKEAGAKPRPAAPKNENQLALKAVAQHFSATWDMGENPPDGYLNFAGKRVAVEVKTLQRRGVGESGAARPQLRFDKVVTRLLDRLRAALSPIVPDGVVVLLTVTAPIRLPSKTAAAIEDKIQELLAGKRLVRDEQYTVHGNEVRIRLLRGHPGNIPKLVGFVHNPDSDPIALFNMTQELLDLRRAEADLPATTPRADRWLIVVSARGSSHLEAYREIYSQLRRTSPYKKIVIAFDDGHVETLTEGAGPTRTTTK